MSTLLDLWHESTDGTLWSTLKIEEELRHIERLAKRPRIPQDHLIFRVFRAFPEPHKQIKVVLLGQDPYPGMLEIMDEHGETMWVSRACGFSFSAPLGPIPVSLQTVFREILLEYPQPPVQEGKHSRSAKASDYSGDLSYLVADGVFLLNTFLTIHREGNEGKPKSHTSWECFSTQVLSFIRRTCPNAVYLALGRPAADLMKASGITDAIETDHPAARGRGRNPFNGSNVFINANEILVKRGVAPVDWVPMKEAVDTHYYEPSHIAPRARTMDPVLAEMIARAETERPPEILSTDDEIDGDEESPEE